MKIQFKTNIYKDLNITVFDNFLEIDGLKFVHEFANLEDEFFIISGHTHPGVSIKGKGRQRIKLPCFQVTKQQLILPAFSLFTGLNTKDFPKDCTNYCFTNDGIFEV